LAVRCGASTYVDHCGYLAAVAKGRMMFDQANEWTVPTLTVRSTGSPMPKASKRSGQSATRTWWRAGLPEPRPDHLKAVACLALAMRDEIAAIAEQTGRD
jgi:hypothetical protein